MSKRDGEFYVGYLPNAPPALGRRTAIVAGALAALGLIAAGILAAAQARFGNGTFAWGEDRPHEGVLRADPYPRLENDGASRLLVGRGKLGAAEAAPLAGRLVRLEGSRIARGGTEMLEVAPDSLRALDGAGPGTEAVEELGSHRLVGEIVDSKCFLGVMNPGELKPHRACAIRCISGGVPPMLVVRDRDGRAAHFLLVSSSGAAVNREVLDLVALPVSIEGSVERRGGLLYLKADPATYRRVP